MKILMRTRKTTSKKVRDGSLSVEALYAWVSQGTDPTFLTPWDLADA